MPAAAANSTKPAAGRPYTAIILAGKRPGVDPVAAAEGQTYKALVNVCDAPMVTHVVAALGQSPHIGAIVIVAELEPARVEEIPGLTAAAGGKPVGVTAARATISQSVLDAIASRPDDARFLITTSDHPLLTPEIVGEFLENAQGQPGVCIAMVEEQIIEKAYPGMRRTYLKFRDDKLSGANLFAVNGREAIPAIHFFRRIEENRKKPWKMMLAFGLFNCIGFMLKRFTLSQAFLRVSAVLNCPVRPVKLNHANAAVDVDKAEDLAFVKTILSKGADFSSAAPD